jgi:tetratricopeptide (TPR) repeat protein
MWWRARDARRVMNDAVRGRKRMMKPVVAACLLAMLGASGASASRLTQDPIGPVTVIGTTDLGMCIKSVESDEMNEALYWCTRTLRRSETSVGGRAAAYLHRGVLYLRRDNQQAAMRDIDEALRLDPHYGDAHFNKANLLFSMGQYQAALASYNEAQRLGVTVPELLHFNRAATHRRLSSDALASADLAQAKALATKSSPIYDKIR